MGFILHIYLELKENAEGNLHETHWWQIKEVRESKEGKFLRLNKKRNEEIHTFIVVVQAFIVNRDGMQATRSQ